MSALTLARDTVDIGLMSDNPAMPNFYTNTVGLPFVESLVHSDTYQEKFYGLPDAALKINATSETMDEGTSGYCGLVVARAGVRDAKHFVDPDGLAISVVPPGHGGITQVGIVCEVADVEAERRFLLEGVGATERDGSLRIGQTTIELRPGTPPPPTPTWRRGFNYYVVFVTEIAGAHQHLLESGAEHSASPVRLGDRCAFSWLRAPSGNWIELVQYPDTAPMPDAPLAADRWPEITRWRETGEGF